MDPIIKKFLKDGVIKTTSMKEYFTITGYLTTMTTKSFEETKFKENGQTVYKIELT